MKKLLALLLALALVFTFAACSNDNSTEDEDAANTDTVEPVDADGTDDDQQTDEDDSQDEDATADGVVSITHEYGVTEVAVNPERLVVFDLGILDILNKVGISVGSFPMGSTLPDYLSHLVTDDVVNAGGMKEIDFDAVYEYAPDLIIISGRVADSYDACAEIAPTLYVYNPGSEYLEQMGDNIAVLKQIFPDKADELQSSFDEILDAAKALQESAEQSGLNALVMMANDGSISFFGAGSRYGLIHDDFGFAEAATTAIEDSTHGAEGTFEYIAEVNPDVIFVIDRSAAIGTEGEDGGAAALLDNDLVNGTTAAQEGRVIYLSSNVWYLVSGGLDSTMQMVQEVAAALD